MSEPTPEDAAALPAGEQVGHYRILGVLGRGGMGVVYRAEQIKPHREVALKVVRGDLGGARLVRRFEHEAEVLARLQHPGIAQIYEAGSIEVQGRLQPFLAMELVDGVPLDQFAQSLPVERKVELMAQLCDAVEHAHKNGVIHRDLKPANVLVTKDGTPKVLDFGLARATESDLNATSMHTQAGELLGTIPYMSPEQVSGDPAAIDTRTDVYSLGVIAHQLLVGALPYELPQTSFLEALEVIREKDPTPLGSVVRSLRGDVETIVLKALEKDKERRYASAQALGDDLRRHLAEEPIQARPASTLYQLVKFTRRNRILVGGVAATFLALLAGLIVSVNYGRKEATQRAAAELAREQADDARTAAQAAQKDEERQRRAAEEAKDQADLARQAAVEAQRDLEQVVEFQRDMLRTVDPQKLGAELVADLRHRIQDVHRSDPEVEATLARFDQMTAPVNRADAALYLLDQGILTRVNDTIGRRFADQPELAAEMFFSLAYTYSEIGLYAGSARATRRAYEALPPGVDDARRVLFRTYHADMLARSGNLDQAVQILRECLADARHLHGDKHADTEEVAGMLVGHLHAQGKIDEACALGEEFAPYARERFFEQGVQDSTLLLHLTQIYIRQGRIELAEPFMEAAVQRLRDQGWTLQVFRYLNNLGYLRERQGRLEEAEEMYWEALQGLEEMSGKEHPEYPQQLNNLAYLYQKMGRYDEAEEMMQEAIALYRSTLGPVHVHLGVFLHTLAEIYLAAERFEEAIEQLEEALATYEASGSTQYHGLLFSQLGTALAAVGDVEGALESLQRADREGFRDPQLLDDEWFDELREEVEFQTLARRWGGTP